MNDTLEVNDLPRTIVAAVAHNHAPSLVLTGDVQDMRLLCNGADIIVCHPRDAL